MCSLLLVYCAALSDDSAACLASTQCIYVDPCGAATAAFDNSVFTRSLTRAEIMTFEARPATSSTARVCTECGHCEGGDDQYIDTVCSFTATSGVRRCIDFLGFYATRRKDGV